MKWTEYPTQYDRKRRENGTTRSGLAWSDAPGGRWVVPDDDSGYFALVHGRTEPWSIPEENLKRQPARAARGENP